MRGLPNVPVVLAFPTFIITREIIIFATEIDRIATQTDFDD